VKEKSNEVENYIIKPLNVNVAKSNIKSIMNWVFSRISSPMVFSVKKSQY